MASTPVDIISIMKMKDNPELLIARLQDWGLVPKTGIYKCHKCEHILTLTKRSQSADGYHWTCNGKISIRKQKTKLCNNAVSLRRGTFFERSSMALWEVLLFVVLWVNDVQLSVIAEQLRISRTTAVDWASFCREVVLDKYLLRPVKLGGPGVIVEIDESKFGKRKYHRGRLVEGQWVFGGYERGTGRVFMVPVEDRGVDTLVPIIKDWILPGTTIISDYWRTYDCLENEGYVHLKVNHSVNFVDPESGAHTNSIESIWRAAKAVVSTSGRKKQHIPGKLAKYIFNKSCKETQNSRAINFLKLAGNLYDPTNPLKDIPPLNLEEVAEEVDED